MKKLTFIVAYLFLIVPCIADIIIVDDDWPYDFDNIQAAIDDANNGDYIIVFPGTYIGPGNRLIDFLGKAIIVQSVDPTDPYVVAQTVIDCNGYAAPAFYFHSGEDLYSALAGFTITNGGEPSGGGIYCEYGGYYGPTIAYCVITGNNGAGIYCKYSLPIIGNCTITDNNGPGVYCDTYADSLIVDCKITDNNDAGICCGANSSPDINDCIISGNFGSGIYCQSDSNATITGCTISDHNYGSGIYCDYSSPIIAGCTIRNNKVYDFRHRDGGGIFCVGSYDRTAISSPKITNCIITGNSAWGNGGGIFCDFETSPKITNCIITGNSADHDGGGIYCEDVCSVEITNCTVSGNFAGYGGGIWCSSSTGYEISNCILWGNIGGDSIQSAQIDGEMSRVWFSCIQDEYPDDDEVPFGEELGNIDDDPCFVQPGFWADANDPNIILEPPYVYGGVWYDGDYHLLASSPCIEAGYPYSAYNSNDVDIDAQPRLMGQCVDMGADEFELSIIIVTRPQAGDVWAAGSTRQIEWESNNITGTVDIYYSDNNGTDWAVVDNNVPDTGSFTWLLPGAVDSNQCRISVEPNTPVTNLTCVPSGLFTIHPDSTGPLVASKWKSLGGDYDRSGLSENFGPELGCVKWQFQTDGPVSASPSVGAAGRIHLSCEDGKLYTLDPNGLLLWSYDTNSPLLSAPSVGPDGSLFVGAQNGKVYAIDVNGNLRWTHTTDGFIYSSPAVAADGNIYACSQDGKLYALAQDGSELWTLQTDGLIVAAGSVFASPVVGPNNTLLVTGFYKPDLYAIDSNTGSVKWICDFSDPNTTGKAPWPFASPVIADDGTIYQTLLHDPNLYAIPAQLIEDGQFITTGGLRAGYIAALDSNIFRPVGNGMDDVVKSLTFYNDQLIAGGSFNEAGGAIAENIAAWNGRCWRSLEDDVYGHGVEGEVYALTVYNSKLIAGGSFNWAGGVSANNIAQWNGSSWQSLGSGVDKLGYACVYALTVYNGKLIAAGEFTTAGGEPANRIAAWDGENWFPLGLGMNDCVYALTVYNGQLIAAGEFTTAGGEEAIGIAAWDGENWFPLGLGMNDFVYALTVYDGLLIAAGEFTTADGISANKIAAWDGSSWQPLGSGVERVCALMAYNGELIAGGIFHEAGGVDANSIAAWNGTSWRSLESRMNNAVEALTVYNGDLIAGGEFTTAPNYASIAWSANLTNPACFVIPLPYGLEDKYIIGCEPFEYEEHGGCRDYYIEIDGHQFDVYRECEDGEREYRPGVYPSPYAHCWSEPALGPDGTIYVSFDDSYLRAVDPNGSIKWMTRLGTIGGFTLTVGSNGLIYAASDDAYLCVIDPNGKELARFKGDNWLSFPVITADNTVIVSDANNTVWAIGGSGCEGQPASLHRPQDLSADRAVNFYDFALIANDWLKFNCFSSDELPPCEDYPDYGIYFTGDIDRDLYVDFADLADLANHWLNEEQ